MKAPDSVGRLVRVLAIMVAPLALSIIVLDWDDTIFPTSWWLHHREPPTLQEARLLRNWARSASEFLATVQGTSSLAFVLTAATKTWVKQCIDFWSSIEALPYAHTVGTAMPVHSVHDKGMNKADALCEVLRELRTEMESMQPGRQVKIDVCMCGDQDTDMFAAHWAVASGHAHRALGLRFESSSPSLLIFTAQLCAARELLSTPWSERTAPGMFRELRLI